jgi:hypothetical protein
MQGGFNDIYVRAANMLSEKRLAAVSKAAKTLISKDGDLTDLYISSRDKS